MFHHLLREFICEEGDGGSVIKRILCFISKSSELGDKCAHITWGP